MIFRFLFIIVIIKETFKRNLIYTYEKKSLNQIHLLIRKTNVLNNVSRTVFLVEEAN